MRVARKALTYVTAEYSDARQSNSILHIFPCITSSLLQHILKMCFLKIIPCVIMAKLVIKAYVRLSLP